MTRRVVLIGAGGHGRELLDLLEEGNRSGVGWDILGFLSDHPVAEEPITRRGYRVLGPVAGLADLEADHLLAIGDGRVRRAVDTRLPVTGSRPVSVVHPRGSRASDSAAGEGLVVAAGARVEAGSVIGRHVHLNTNATVMAGARVGDYVTVSPGAVVASDAVVGAGAFVGVGALIAEGAVVAPDTMVGAGAVVYRDGGPGSPLVGNPAHPTRSR